MEGCGPPESLVNTLHLLGMFLRRAPRHPSPPSVELNPGDLLPSSGPRTRRLSSLPPLTLATVPSWSWSGLMVMLCLSPSSSLPRTLHLLLAARQSLRRGSTHCGARGTPVVSGLWLPLQGTQAPGPPCLGSVCVTHMACIKTPCSSHSSLSLRALSWPLPHLISRGEQPKLPSQPILRELSPDLQPELPLPDTLETCVGGEVGMGWRKGEDAGWLSAWMCSSRASLGFRGLWSLIPPALPARGSDSVVPCGSPALLPTTAVPCGRQGPALDLTALPQRVPHDPPPST